MISFNSEQKFKIPSRFVGLSRSDVVLDPFCGCGTTIAAAQRLNREWIGIDVTHLSVGLMKLRLKDSFGMLPGARTLLSASVPLRDADGRDVHSSSRKSGSATPEEPALRTGVSALHSYRVVGQPEDLEGAKELAEHDKYGFQWWILPLIGARALGAEKSSKEGKKGSDKGIDGIMVFTDDNSGKAKRVMVSVGARTLLSAPTSLRRRENPLAKSGCRDPQPCGQECPRSRVFLSLDPPTKPMLEEAAGKGFYHSPGWNKDYPRLQILTVEDLLAGKTVDLPPNLQTYKQADKVVTENRDQGMLGF